MKSELAKLMMKTSLQMMKTSTQMMLLYGKKNDNAKELKNAAIMLADWALEVSDGEAENN